MTISGFQSYSFSAISLSMTVTRAASTPPGGAAALTPPSDAAVDRVSLSPDATTAAANTDEAAETETPELPAAAPAPSVPPPSRAARRADALFTALDGDKDGAITEDEFTEGALKLLRNAGARRRIDDDSDGEGRDTRGLRRLERKIERAFERVDKNDDGAIDKDELTAALSRGRGRRGGPDEAPPADAPPAEGQAAGISISISVTYVSIAMQRYTSVQKAAAPDAKSTSTSPAPDESTAVPAPAGKSTTDTPALAA